MRLHEPLLGSSTQNLDLDVELMSLCSQLDMICQKELSKVVLSIPIDDILFC